MSNMKRNMFIVCIVSAIFSLIFYFANAYYYINFCYPLFITSATIFYHVGIRLIVGYSLDGFKQHDFSYDKGIFKEFAFEKKLYKLLKVKTWKDKMPTFNPSTFNMENNSTRAIINVMCVSELVHLTNVPLSFIPLTACYLVPQLKEDIFIFTITGICAACFDMLFVIMQRYNRPRIIKLLKRQQKTAKQTKHI